MRGGGVHEQVKTGPRDDDDVASHQHALSHVHLLGVRTSPPAAATTTFSETASPASEFQGCTQTLRPDVTILGYIMDVCSFVKTKLLLPQTPSP